MLPIRFLKAAVRSLVVGVVDGAITVDASPDSCREDAVEMPAADVIGKPATSHLVAYVAVFVKTSFALELAVESLESPT